jgi:hypothetical protein
MPSTYYADLRREIDWVRLQIGDTDVPNTTLKDETIQALLNEEQNRYLAAARAGNLVISQSEGLVSKQVGELRIQFSDSNSEESAYRGHLKMLYKRGVELTFGHPSFFRVL